ETTLTVWDDKDAYQSINVTVTSRAAEKKWELAATPLQASEIPGFVQFNFKRGVVHLAIAQVAAIAIEDHPSAKRARIILNRSDSADLPDEEAIPPEALPAEKAVELIKRVKEKA